MLAFSTFIVFNRAKILFQKTLRNKVHDPVTDLPFVIYFRRPFSDRVFEFLAICGCGQYICCGDGSSFQTSGRNQNFVRSAHFVLIQVFAQLRRGRISPFEIVFENQMESRQVKMVAPAAMDFRMLQTMRIDNQEPVDMIV